MLVISRKSVENLRAAIFIGDLKGESDTEAIRKMLSALDGHPQVNDFDRLAAAVFERQQTDPPLFPGGIAFPHARTDGVSALVMVCATCKEAILFGDTKVRLIFLIGVPKHAGAEYLEMISFLARHVRGQQTVSRLVDAKDLSSFLSAFVEPNG
jgi:mannitol/fructose-specific phosphotransferase system IIA component (Ntr-type)